LFENLGFSSKFLAQAGLKPVVSAYPKALINTTGGQKKAAILSTSGNPTGVSRGALFQNRKET
jgi:hypothetical protein